MGTLCTIERNFHSWPGAGATWRNNNEYKGTQDIDGNTAIWEFFETSVPKESLPEESTCSSTCEDCRLQSVCSSMCSVLADQCATQCAQFCSDSKCACTE